MFKNILDCYVTSLCVIKHFDLWAMICFYKFLTLNYSCIPVFLYSWKSILSLSYSQNINKVRKLDKDDCRDIMMCKSPRLAPADTERTAHTHSQANKYTSASELMVVGTQFIAILVRQRLHSKQNWITQSCHSHLSNISQWPAIVY